MTCHEVLELIPAAIDGEVGEDILSVLNRHLGECSPCRTEFELERMTKRVVRRQISPAEAPSGLQRRIRQQIAAERFSSEPRAASGKRINQPPWKMMLAIASVAAVVLLLTLITPSKSHHSHAQPADGNIIHQTYNNFDDVLDGRLHPQIVSDDPVAVRAFFEPMVKFKVHVPKMKKFKLLGAVCSQYQNQCIAQLIYQGAHDIVYLYQIGCAEAFDRKGDFRLPAEAVTELQRTGWYFENHIPDCSLALWVKDSTLCCALADINKDVLLASLTGED